MNRHRRTHTASTPASTIGKIAIAWLLCCILIAPASAQQLPAQSITIDNKQTPRPLIDTIRDVCRSLRLTPLIDDSVQDTDINLTYRGRADNFFAMLAQKYSLNIEPLGTDTIYVCAAPPGKQLTAPEPEIASAITGATTLDDLLNMKPAPQSAQDEQVEDEVTSSPTTQSDKRIVLQGSIEHKNQLEPAPQTLREGARLDMARLQSLTPGNVWSRLPNWAGGTWHTVALTAHYRYNYLNKTKDFTPDTFMDKASETMGWQKDVRGDLWHFVGTDFYTISEGQDSFSVDFHKYHEIPEQDDEHFVVRHVCSRAIVPKSTRKISRVLQLESINVYTCKDKNTIRCKSSIKEFDAHGRPASLQKGVAYELRIADYTSWDTYHGKDMRKLFKEYLATHGLQHLISKN